MTKPLLRIRDVAELLNIHERTARTLVYGDKRRGKEPVLASFIVGDGSRRIDPAEVERYVRSLQASE